MHLVDRSQPISDLRDQSCVTAFGCETCLCLCLTCLIDPRYAANANRGQKPECECTIERRPDAARPFVLPKGTSHFVSKNLFRADSFAIAFGEHSVRP